MRTFNNTCIAFNGPPGIGKDTLVAMMVPHERTTVHVGTLSVLIREEAEKYYNYPGLVANWDDRDWKEAHCPILGKTRRQAIIDYCEQVVKPNKGSDYFAEQFADAMSNHKCSIMTDLGFDTEAYCLSEKIDLVIIVQLHHPDFDFSKDSRSYVEIDAPNVRTIKYWTHRGDPYGDMQRINDLIVREFEDYCR